MPRAQPPTLFETWADRQRVRRPFDALVAMGHQSRVQIAEHLGIKFDEVVSEAKAQAAYDLNVDEEDLGSFGPRGQAEACLIIGMDGKGIQARSHGWTRKLSPRRNHTWREILKSVAEDFEVTGRSASSAAKLESAIYEHLADQALEQLDEKQTEEIEKFLREQPGFAKKLRQAGYGAAGIRLAAASVFGAAAGGSFRVYITAVKAAAFLNKKLGMKLAMNAVAAGLKRALTALSAVMWIWLATDVLHLLFGPSRGRLLFVIAEIHQFRLLQRMG